MASSHSSRLRGPEKDNDPLDRHDAYYAEAGQYYGGGYYAGAYYGGQASGISVASMLRIVRRKWLYIVVGTALGLMWAGVKIHRSVALYMAQSTLEMRVRRPRIMDREEAVMSDRTSSWNADEVFKTRLEKFRSHETRQIAQEVLRESGASNVIAAASFSLVPDSFLVRIGCVHPDREWAARSANAWAEATVLMMAKENKDLSDNAVAWLKKQAEAQEAKLVVAENELANFRAESKLDVLVNQKSSIGDELRSLSMRLTDIQANMLLSRERLAALEKASAESEMPSDIPESETIREQMSQMREARKQLADMLSRYRSKHPDVIAAVNRVAVLKKDVESAIGRAMKKAQSDLSLLERQCVGLEAEIRRRKDLAAEVDVKIINLQARLTTLERSQQAADLSYRGVLNRMEEARLAADEDTAVVKVLNTADTPVFPISPNKKKLLMTGLMLGAMLGMGLAFGKDWLEDFVTCAEDIETGLNMRVLGVIPRLKGEMRSRLGRSVLEKRDQVVAETFAGIRVSLAVGPSKEVSRSLLITSAGVGCGKTILASNLASTYALSGIRTLLIDLDLRRPRIAKVFGVRAGEKNSLYHRLASSRLTDEHRFDELIVKTGCPDLDLVVSVPGRGATHSDVVGGGPIGELIEWAKARYDQVIVDSPPYGFLSDAAVIAQHVGGIVLVARAEKSRKRAVKHTVGRLTNIGATILGCVLNGVSAGRSIFSSYSYRHQQYAYSESEIAENEDLS